MNEEQELLPLRQAIDDIDQQLHTLLNRRAECAMQVAEVKQRYAPAGQEVTFYRPEREAQVLRTVMECNTGPLSDESAARIFREIMSHCLALEAPLNVAYLGPEGTFTQQAANKHFGHAAHCYGMTSIADVFREVESGSAAYGVVPVENSTEGMVSHTLDSFYDTSLSICGEVSLPIHHHFMLSPQANADDIDCIYSHAQSLGQCRAWLDKHYPNVRREAVSSNAEAARLAQANPNSAAIASEAAADVYNLTVSSARIEDRANNTTRFLIISKQVTQPSGKDKTSILVGSDNKPGALFTLLEPFSKAGVSLTRIETRPARTGTWEYMFYIDCDGHVQDDRLGAVFEQIKGLSTHFKWLGSYPKAVV